MFLASSKSLWRNLGLIVLGWALSHGAVQADVKLPPVISSHMVLQREVPVPIWGTANAGEEVTVTFRDQSKSTKADEKGKWLVKLDPLKAGGPDNLTIAGKNKITLDDVLVGEVWVGSGQSNMQGTVNSYIKGDPVLEKLSAGTYPKLRLITSGRPGWVDASPKNNQAFSALLFGFGVRLQEKLDMPVGLMVGAVGGTPSGYWLTPEMMAADAPVQELIKKGNADPNVFEAQKAKYATDLAKWEKDVEIAKKEEKKLPPRPAAPLRVGESQGKIGNLYDAHIKPYLPYAIRGVVWDQGESGTAVSGIDQYTLMGALIRGWRLAWGVGEFPFIFIQKPSGGGCAWDNTDPMMTSGEKFQPLPAAVPALAAANYRETHIRIKNYPNTLMAITSDLGPGVHPINKSGYGARASQVALGKVYGQQNEYYGPVFQSLKTDGGKLRVSFTHVGKGLASKHGKQLQGFAIAGEDKNFHWADAVIEGDTVILSSPKVSQPVAVRYAFGPTHHWANLFNQDGFPAIPFRSDSWEK